MKRGNTELLLPKIMVTILPLSVSFKIFFDPFPFVPQKKKNTTKHNFFYDRKREQFFFSFLLTVAKGHLPLISSAIRKRKFN